MDNSERVKEHILNLVAAARQKRLRPIEVKRILEDRFHHSRFSVQKALQELVRSGDLLLTYRDPCNYVEIPLDHERKRPESKNPFHTFGGFKS